MLGLLIGAMMGGVGGGGAILAVPVMVYLLGQSAQSATTTSLVVVAAAAIAGAATHARQGGVCWRMALAFTVAAVPGSLVGTTANRFVGAGVLTGAFALLMLGIAAMTWRNARRAPRIDRIAEAGCPALDVERIAGAGLATGLLTGFFGVGGGFAIVPALNLGLRVPIRRAVATSLVIVSMVSLVGLFEHLQAGSHVDWAIATPFAIATSIGAVVGGAAATRLPQRRLASAFAVVIAIVAAGMLTSAGISQA